ncbi:hypothetical protein [Paenibacillus lautus]|uniref:hypothetical protein n=1 Tax=Paenibacillus lautus TaxID=1401 RepID=UPI001C7DAD27|nr:hypothetical protein [Paenibacillus lautus]MBX4147134.1 hypothetical protein [Paenibacillus lautus]
MLNRPYIYEDESIEGYINRVVALNYQTEKQLNIPRLPQNASEEHVENYLKIVEDITGQIKLQNDHLVYKWRLNVFKRRSYAKSTWW